MTEAPGKPADNLTRALAGPVCPLCSGAGSVVGEKNGVPLRACTCAGAGVLLCWGWESPAEYEAQYAELDYHENTVKLQGLPPIAERFVEHCEAARCRIHWLLDHGFGFQPNQVSLLDIGAGNGALVAVAERKYRWRAVGIEPSRAMCEIAWEHRGIPFIHGTWDRMAAWWDVVTATDVIEHLLEPAAFLERCAEHTRRVYLETPDWPGGDPAAWEHNRHIRTREHPCLWSESAILELARRAGWEPQEVYRPIPGKLGMLLESLG